MILNARPFYKSHSTGKGHDEQNTKCDPPRYRTDARSPPDLRRAERSIRKSVGGAPSRGEGCLGPGEGPSGQVSDPRTCLPEWAVALATGWPGLGVGPR